MRREIMVRALETFVDEVTGERVEAGEELSGWSEGRARLYEAAGMVEVIERTRVRRAGGGEQRKPTGPEERKHA